jgi:hypothetical protein
MTDDVQLSYSRTFPADVERAFDEVLPHDLARLFNRRYAAIPPIKIVRDQAGPWSTAGQTRTIALADGGTMREELLEVTRPTRFAYHITAITGAMPAFGRMWQGYARQAFDNIERLLVR